MQVAEAGDDHGPECEGCRAVLEHKTPTTTRIIDVATGLFYEKGYYGTTMREIAAEVGIKAASVYNHFAGKEDILFDITFGAMEEMLAGARAAISSAASPEAQLRRLVEFHVRYSAENRLRAKVADEQLHALSPERRRSVLKIRDQYEALFREILSRGRDECDWQVDDVPVVTFAIATMASAVGVWYREDGRLAADTIASIYGDLAVRAIIDRDRPVPSPPPSRRPARQVANETTGNPACATRSEPTARSKRSIAPHAAQADSRQRSGSQ